MSLSVSVETTGRRPRSPFRRIRDDKGELTEAGWNVIKIARKLGLDIEKMSELEAMELLASEEPVPAPRLKIREHGRAQATAAFTAAIADAASAPVVKETEIPDAAPAVEPEEIEVLAPPVELKWETAGDPAPEPPAEPEVVAEPTPVPEPPPAPAVVEPEAAVVATPVVTDAAKCPPPAHGKYANAPITPRGGRTESARVVGFIAPPPKPARRAETPNEMRERLGLRRRR